MKKMMVVAAVLVLTVVAFRRFGPTLAKRAMAHCQEMMAKCQEMMAKCQEMMAGHLGDAGELLGPDVPSKDEPGSLADAPGQG
jgi:hypothetical protein